LTWQRRWSSVAQQPFTPPHHPQDPAAAATIQVVVIAFVITVVGSDWFWLRRRLTGYRLGWGIVVRAATERAFEREETDGIVREVTEDVGEEAVAEETVEEVVAEEGATSRSSWW
jgi:hypothetical protein